MKRQTLFILLLLGLSHLLIAHTEGGNGILTGSRNSFPEDSIFGSPETSCHADFSVTLDSANIIPNTFDFFDQSIGDPDTWFWTFGDGTTSNDRNPRHHYAQSGIYKVCLTISRAVPDTNPCYDSTCKIHLTARYSNIGGHVFAGTHPINNPVSTGDTGIAILYRMKNSHPVSVDTVRFTELGYYTFPDVLEGSYFLKIQLSSGSMQYANYFPTYFGNVVNWKSAGMMTLTDSNFFNLDIDLLPLLDTLEGPCQIKGKVVQGDGPLPAHPLPNTQVMLFDSGLHPLDYTFSDFSGNYEFSSLAYGAYTLYLESTGKFSRYTTILLDEFHPLADDVKLELFNHDVTGISEYSNPGLIAGNVFPNPAKDQLSVNIWSDNHQEVLISILSFTGNSLFTGVFSCQGGLNSHLIPLYQIKSGLYFLVIKKIDGSLLRAQKFLKN